MLNFYPPLLCRVLAAILKMADILKILKMQNCSANGDLSLCQNLCLYQITNFTGHQLPVTICGTDGGKSDDNSGPKNLLSHTWTSLPVQGKRYFMVLFI
jgi:hypothetical protein